MSAGRNVDPDRGFTDLVERMALRIASLEASQAATAPPLHFPTVAARDAWPGPMVARQRCVVAATDTEYLWNGTGWVTARYPLVGTATMTVTSVTQNVNVSFTQAYGQYRIDHGEVHARYALNLTSAGTAGYGILVATNLPTPREGVGYLIGTFHYMDSGTAYYVGGTYSTALVTGGHLFIQDGAGAALGAGFAIASGDRLEVDVHYFI